MDNDCFNLGIRIVACDAILQLVEIDVHYMDLRCCVSYHNIVLLLSLYVSKPLFSHDGRFHTRSEVALTAKYSVADNVVR